MEDYIKVGKTKKNPKERAQELSSATGVPSKFMVAYYEYFNDCTKAENYIHNLLEEKGYRAFENKEFFEAPLSEAIKIISHVNEKLSTNRNNEFLFDAYDDVGKDDNELLIDNLLEEANEYIFGKGDKFKDRAKAMNLLKKASKLGSAEANVSIGILYENGDQEDGIKKDIKSALSYYQEAIKKGLYENYIKIAEMFIKNRQVKNAEKAIRLYINTVISNIFKSDNYSTEDFLNPYGLATPIGMFIQTYMDDIRRFYEDDDINLSNIRVYVDKKTYDDIRYKLNLLQEAVFNPYVQDEVSKNIDLFSKIISSSSSEGVNTL